MYCGVAYENVHLLARAHMIRVCTNSTGWITGIPK